MNTAALPARARRSRWIPWVFFGGFGVVLAANVIMVTFAINSFTGLTTSEPYTKGLRYNEQLRQAEAQQRLGWHIASAFRKSGPLHGEIELKLTDRAGAPLAGATVEARFERPVERGHDFPVILQSAGNGRYVASAAFPLRGAWDVRYRIARDGAVLEARERLEIE